MFQGEARIHNRGAPSRGVGAPTAFVYGGEGPNSMFLGKGASQGQFFFMGGGESRKAFLRN